MDSIFVVLCVRRARFGDNFEIIVSWTWTYAQIHDFNKFLLRIGLKCTVRNFSFSLFWGK